MSISEAVKTLQGEMASDYSYAWAWHCNIACPVMDSGVDHETANKAASRVMQQLFGIDTSKGHP